MEHRPHQRYTSGIDQMPVVVFVLVRGPIDGVSLFNVRDTVHAGL